MSKTDIITQARLKELLSYDPLTGLFIWLVRMNQYALAGSVAGNTDSSSGYIRITLDGRKYQSHRLVWFFMTGEWPIDQIDHKDRIKTNNRWDNLKESTNAENCRNRSMRSNNTSGHNGIYWNKALEKWHVRPCVNGEKIHIGFFANKFDALAARKAADIKYEFSETHGI